MKKLVIVGILLFACLSAYAGFGGSRSSFGGSSSRSSYSPSRSFFGGSRSSGQSATITRPVAPTRTTIIHNTTVVNRDRGYNGGSNSLVTGMLIGSAMSRPRQVVYVNGQPQPQIVYADGQVVQQPAVVVKESSSSLFWGIIFGILAIIVVFLIIRK